MKSIIVFYHANCPDGFSAAWAAWKKFGAKAQYVPISASQTADQLGNLEVANRDVYFLDVCAVTEDLKKLTVNNRLVTVIDHHPTNHDRGSYVTNFIFNLKHSGAVLAWKYFHPDKDVPLLLKYVEDNDLWKFKMPNAYAVGNWLGLANFKFKEWNNLAETLENKESRTRAVAAGKIIGEYRDGIIRDVLDHAYEVEFLGYRAMAVNEAVGSINSLVGHRLIDKDHPVGIVWYENGKSRKISLRSKGDTDVSKLAAKFPGGGGHKHASGFTLPASEPFPWKIIRK
jgi:oligoribonuclease NrnB/cAMP/cGMP phosphodiesterase (DHH superfamily)